MLADRAAAMAREAGLAVDILDEKKMQELKMGALLSVAQGSAEPPRMIVITYTPEKLDPKAPVLGLVGKAITFDTGGISIKPANDMEKMKYDMCGGAAMIGAMRALARLKPSCKVIAVIPSSENMPGGRAQKPGDVQIRHVRKIHRSDQHRRRRPPGPGRRHRLREATGLHASGRRRNAHRRDCRRARATSTSACSAPIKPSPTSSWPARKRREKKCGRCPIDDDYREMIKSGIADIQNVGSGKGGGAITGAMFIKEFTGDTPWIHLDIAGTAWQDDVKPWNAKGATGVAVRTLVDLAMKFGSNGSSEK